jgi:outer membrane protein
MRFLTAATVLLLASAAMAQTSSGSTAALPAAPSSAGDPAAVTAPTGTKVGTIDMETAILLSNEGQRDFDALSKKLEPKENELKGRNDDIENLKKQLNTQGDKLNEEAKNNLTKQIETKQKALERDYQDFQEDSRNQQNEIAQRILQKMLPIFADYAKNNGFALIVDTSRSNQWPNGAVMWNGGGLDVTKIIVDSYNAISGVAAPARPAGGTRPAGSGAAAKPAPPATKPSTTPTTPAKP